MRKVYECTIAGLSDKERSNYVLDHVAAGDSVELQSEGSGVDQVAAFHDGRKIGNLRTRDSWIGPHVARAKSREIRVDDLVVDDQGELAAIDLNIELDLTDAPEPPPSVINQIGEELRLLMTVAMADGSFHAKEKQVLERFAELRAHEVGVTPEEGDVARAVRWARRRVPDSFETAQIIGRLAIDRPSAFEAILEVADIAAEMDGKVVEEEKAKVAMLRELIEVGRQHVTGD